MARRTPPDALPARLCKLALEALTADAPVFEMLLFKVYSHAHGPTCGVTQIH